MKFNRLFLTALSLIIIVLFNHCKVMNKPIGQVNADAFSETRDGFKVPPDSVKPYVYWYWVSDNISREGITKDLEAMAKVGIGEAFIGNIGLETVPYGDVKVLSKEWWELTLFAITEGQRLGVDIGIFNSPGWSQSGGPWIPANKAMRYLVSTETVIDGGKKSQIKLQAFTKDMQDVAVIAFPVSAQPEETINSSKTVISTEPSSSEINLLLDQNLKTAFSFTEKIKTTGLTINLNLSKDFTARSIVIYPDTIPLSCDVELQAFTNGAYKSVKKFLLDRNNPMISVGPDVFGPVSIALSETTSSKYRIIFSNIKNPSSQNKVGGIREIVISSYPKLESYIEKQLAKMLQTPDLAWGEYLWPEQISTGNKEMFVNANQVIDVTGFMDKTGTLSWNAPAGKWIIKRIGLIPTGAKNAPASPEATGYEVDKMQKDYIKDHFNAYIGKILKDLPADKRKSFKHLVIDSYEVGPQNWTEGLAVDFEKKYGYNPILWLPVLSGNIVNSASESNRFLWDLRRLIADRIAYDYAGGLRELSEQNGLKLWLENYGHWGFPGEFLIYGGQTHDIAGEFWVEGTLGNVECRAASSAAHIYGKNKVFAESYTAGGKPYERYPGYLKKRGDWSFTEGINHVLLHVYIHQPYEDKNPGMNAWFGTEFNRKNTWFDQSKNWIDYQRRCMFMLQQGKPVNDVCYFVGEDAPKLVGETNPALPQGYSYDYINSDVILNRLSVKNGRLTLPDGMSYGLMVLPPLETITPELLQKIKDLVSAGAVVLGPKPNRSPSLKNFPFADKEVNAIANDLWGATKSSEKKAIVVGKGLVLNEFKLDEALDFLKISKDFQLSANKPLLFTHRSNGKQEIYFITNQSDEKFDVDATFRVKGKQPEIWNAINGTTRKLSQFSEVDAGTKVPLHFEPSQSYFIVFNEAGNAEIEGKNFPEANVVEEIKAPWQVSFQSGKRGPTGVQQFTTLQDWTKSTNDSIKYFSGTAIYKNTFKGLKPTNSERILLDIGEVGNMAKISVNGKLVGGLWTAPWQIDITDFVSDSTNKVEIEVVNLWVNRMIGDSKLSPDKRPTWLANNYFNPTDPLHPSGILGPVAIKKVNK